VSVVRLLVLGVIRIHKRAYGYAVHRELLSWKIQTWTTVRPGSIYHALNQLTKERKLRAIGTQESETGPGRMLYELTQQGAAEFKELLLLALSSFQLVELSAGVAFMQTLPRHQVIGLLKEQHERSTQTRKRLLDLTPSFPERDQPPHTQDLLMLWGGAAAAIAEWTENLIQRLEAGEYTFRGESRPPMGARARRRRQA